MRRLPLLFSLLTLAPLFLICRELGFSQPGIAFTFALATVNQQLIHYSQELRMYSLLVLLSLVSLWLFVRLGTGAEGWSGSRWPICCWSMFTTMLG